LLGEAKTDKSALTIMKKSTKQPNPLTTSSDAASRATAAGTTRYADRFREQFVADFYRSSPLGASTSSIGLGTYLGDAIDEDVAQYALSARRAIGSGINLIDTAINYRCQRSERSVCVAIEGAIGAGEATRVELVVCT
jgi:hypothetical protein